MVRETQQRLTPFTKCPSIKIHVLLYSGAVVRKKCHKAPGQKGGGPPDIMFPERKEKPDPRDRLSSSAVKLPELSRASENGGPSTASRATRSSHCPRTRGREDHQGPDRRRNDPQRRAASGTRPAAAGACRGSAVITKVISMRPRCGPGDADPDSARGGPVHPLSARGSESRLLRHRRLREEPRVVDVLLAASRSGERRRPAGRADGPPA